MTWNIVTGLIPVGVALAGMIPIITMVHFWRLRDRRFARESPLTRNLLRSPGYSLRKKIDDISEKIDGRLLCVTIVPTLAFTVHLCQSYYGEEAASGGRIVVTVLFAVVVVAFAGWQLVQLLVERRKHILGLEGELATGEELNQLMLDGCRVFHDVPFPYGNIDHVVVSQSGVYSVETKMLGKQKDRNGNANVTVDHQRNVVRFPDWDYQIPSDQLEAESKWLADFLTSAVGEPVFVELILALPGWFVKDRIGRGSVYVINPRNPKKFFVRNHTVLNPKLIQQIAHQLEQRCRDVEPSFREKKNEK